jgi:DNA-binding transcriptional LysR family regulator
LRICKKAALSLFMTAKIQVEWSDFRDLLAFARAASIEAAALALNIDATTLIRRLRRLEQAMGVALILHQGRRLDLTSAGRELMAVAEAMEQEMLGLARHLTAQEPRTEGVVRVTTLRGIFQHYVLPKLGSLRDSHPGIVLELLADARNLSLSRQEADIAIRLARPAGPDLIARKLMDVPYAVYGAEGSGWITYDESLSSVPEAQWLAKRITASQVIMRANSIEVVAAVVRQGLGQAVLPAYAAAGLPAQGGPVLTREAWLVLHTDTRRTPRIRAVADWLTDVFRAARVAGGPQSGQGDQGL